MLHRTNRFSGSVSPQIGNLMRGISSNGSVVEASMERVGFITHELAILAIFRGRIEDRCELRVRANLSG
jgi:hypothetical protein